MNKEDKLFWATAKANVEEVKKWPKWMQKIVINAKNAETGHFIMIEEDWKEKFGDK